MRIAALSDIHGNLPALEAVLAEIGRERVDVVVNLGDILSGPLWPAETAELLMQPRPAGRPWVTIAGNHERQMLAATGRSLAEDSTDSDDLAARATTPAQQGWLHALPAGQRFGDGRGGQVLLTHGTPLVDHEPLLETVTGGAVPGIRAALPHELMSRIGDAVPVDTTLVLCGHSHLPRVLALDGVLFVNPGSVGLQAYDHDQPHDHVVENGSPHARWALLEHTAHFGWQVQQRLTAYGWRAAAARAESQGRPDWADALLTGRVGRRQAG
ncbi:MAG: metallophosphoesterase family protein [Rubrivivax sp.]|jgi:predicted phosphodiesterase